MRRGAADARAAQYREMAAPLAPGGACASATFVTLLAGKRYATAAACLPRQLRQVQSACPILLVYSQQRW